MNCPKCGAQMMPDSGFCGVCGNRLDAGVAPQGSQPGERIHIDDDSRGQGRGYSYEVLHQPAFSLAVVHLQTEQSIQAEAGAMVSMSANIELQSQMKGGLFGAIFIALIAEQMDAVLLPKNVPISKIRLGRASLMISPAKPNRMRRTGCWGGMPFCWGIKRR